MLVAVSPRERLHAQETPPRDWQLEVWGGLAIGSPSWGVLGEAPAMNLGLVGIRFHHALGDSASAGSGRVTEFVADLIPVARLSTPYVSLRGTGYPCEPGHLCVAPHLARGSGVFPRGSAFGIGINPAGILTRWRADRLISPFLGMVVGGLFFDRATPTTQSTRFNFTAAIETGLRLSLPGQHPTFVLTYRLHHLSNAGTGRENPGIASHLFTIGLTRGGRTAHN